MVQRWAASLSLALMVALSAADTVQPSTNTKKKKSKPPAATTGSTSPAAQPAAPVAAPTVTQPAAAQEHKKKKKSSSAEAQPQPQQAATPASQAPAPLSTFLASLPDEKKGSLSELLKKLRDARKLPSEQRKPAMQTIDKSIHELLGNNGYKSWRADMQAKDKERRAKTA